MVLLAGDLFHDNKPSRRTMYKTMEIIRRHCLGPNPVQLEIVSDHASSNIRGACINYEDEYMSVDLPIFSIHGNHDDPTRDGGTEMLAALDLLAVTKFVNYFGRQDEVDKVEIAPILIRKGSSRLALYGMGSMRDERLNRMWQGKKVRFLRPMNENEEEDDGEDDEEAPWFNIFALHQNRDLGRGRKNCVHESMIPEWIDLVVWGHEHECLITPSESAVGTFRISQPGSSVATALTAGEARRKHVGILDVRGSQFRMTPVPLTQVRSFAMGELSLQDQERVINPQDPKVESKILDLLSKEVKQLIKEARESSQHLLEDANPTDNDNYDDNEHPKTSISEKLKYKIIDPEQVLIRLRVEHAGFASLNNQRFGSRFVGEVVRLLQYVLCNNRMNVFFHGSNLQIQFTVFNILSLCYLSITIQANPSDILLFHKRRAVVTKEEKERKDKLLSAFDQPIAPIDLAEVNVEDLIEETLEMSEKKLELLDQHQLGLALDDFVVKELGQAIGETVDKLMDHQQTKLISRGIEQEEEFENSSNNNNNTNNKVTTANAVREICLAEAEEARKKYTGKLKPKDEDKNSELYTETSRKRKSNDDESDSDDGNFPNKKQSRRSPNASINDVDDDKETRNGRIRTTKTAMGTNRRSNSRRTSTRRTASSTYESNSDSDEDKERSVRKTATVRASQSSRPTRRAASSRKGLYAIDDIEDDDEDAFVISQNSKNSIILSDNDDVSGLEPTSKQKNATRSSMIKSPASRQKKLSTTNHNQSQSSPFKSQSQTQLTSFTSTRIATKTNTKNSRRAANRRVASYYHLDDNSDSDDINVNITPSAAGSNWGTIRGKK